MVSWDLEVDAVIVGAGACGLTAAAALAEANFDVVVVEKMGEIRGNTSLSQGMIPGAGTRFQRSAGILDTPEALYHDIMMKNGGTSNPEVTAAVSRWSGAVVDWLVDACNIELSLCTDFNYPGFSFVRMHAPPSRSGQDLLAGLAAHVRQQENVTLALHAPMTKIYLSSNDDTKVDGIEIWQNGSATNIRSKVIVLAANGFGADKAMVREFIPEMAEALYFGHEGNTGDAIKLARALGAQWSSMNGFQGHAAVAIPHGILITWGTIMTGGILLDKQGKRFINELQGYSEMSLEIMKLPDSTAVELFDTESFEAALTVHDFRLAQEIGAVPQFDTLEAFANHFHLPTDNLIETVDAYHRGIDTVDAFGRDQRRHLCPPYFGVRIGAALFHTQGGLKINEHAQVLRTDGRVFENLYAGGGAAEGLSGNHPKGYLSGNGLLSAVTLGYIAGRHAIATVH